MYLQHFGLRDQPFDLTPDSRFYFPSTASREALNVLLLGLWAGEGFIKVTGEVGTGKTLLCRAVINHLEKSCVTAYLPNPQLTPAALNRALAEELGCSLAGNLGNHRVMQVLQETLIEHHRAGRRVVLLLDEVQAMPAETLEAVRLLTNLETETRKLLQVVVFGQPELDRRLARRGLRQLRQRIVYSARLEPFSRAAVRDYVAHRLTVAGHPDGALFTGGAIRALYRGSGGIPRLVNVLAHKSLVVAFGQGVQQVGRRAVRRAIADTESARRPWFRFPRLAASATAAALLLPPELVHWGGFA